jgi:hypothetical protein
MTFPTINAKNLENEPVEIPENLHGIYNLLIVAFKRWHQQLVDTWVPHLTRLKASCEDFDFYELPTLGRIYSLSRFFIDGGMRMGIPSKPTRKHTVTLYLNKQRFKKQLQIPDETTIHLFLVLRDGSIPWHVTGEYSKTNFDDLLDVLTNMKNSIKVHE